MKHLILCIDDEPFNLEIIEGFLDEDKYDILMTDSCTKAWEILQARYNEISTILLDRMMPDMCGIEFTKKVLATPEMAAIPIVMQSAAAQTSQVNEGLEAGAYCYLTKPFSSKQLRNTVEDAIKTYQSRTTMALNLKAPSEELCSD